MIYKVKDPDQKIVIFRSILKDNNVRIRIQIQCHAIIVEWFLRRCHLGNVNMEYRDENSILDKIDKKQIYMDFYYKDLKF